MDINTYASQKPVLKLEEYFSGKLVGHGVFMDRSGEVTRRFVVNITGTVKGNTLTLDEQFTWSDGVKDNRVWTLTQQPNGQWIGLASDVVGQATGLVAGNALNWRYTLAVPVSGSVYNFQFDDWMYLVDERVMINKAVMSKFGIRLGEVLISFSKL